MSKLDPMDLAETLRYEIDSARPGNIPVLIRKTFLGGELASTSERARFRFFFEAESCAALLNGQLEAEGKHQPVEAGAMGTSDGLGA